MVLINGIVLSIPSPVYLALAFSLRWRIASLPSAAHFVFSCAIEDKALIDRAYQHSFEPVTNGTI